MCRTRRDTLVSHPRPTARSTPTRRYSNTNSSSFLPNQTSSSSSSFSNAISTTTTSSSTATTSLTNLHLSLSDNATLYPFSEISTSTRNFRSKPLPSSSSWSCTLRGKQVVILQLPFRGDPASLSSRLSALCKCHHSSLVKLVGASLGGDYIYPVYEFVSGATLRECLRNPRNPDFTTLSKWISRIQIAADLADGLEYIHIHCRTIHNRIKSSTVIVTEPSFNAKICHFGAADLAGEIPDEVVEKIAEEEEEGEGKDEISVVEDEISAVRRSNSRRMKIDGTRGYMAPEVIAGGRISQKSDVFAFGVVILELVSGKEPLKYRTSREAGSEYERVSLIETARDAIGTEDEDGASEMEAEARRWRVRQWVDRRLRDSFPVEVAEKLILVALRCVEEERFMRPEITLVAGMVSKLFLESKVWDERVRLPTDFSVTIGPR